MRPIRKISIGPDYKDAMHFEIGGLVMGKTRVISNIIQIDGGSFEVYVENPDETIEIWKEFKNVPISIEYKINY